jgi:hypothetical protein
MKHTPLPWVVRDDQTGGAYVFDIETADGKGHIASVVAFEEYGVVHPVDRANADLIVTACNNHERLVDALQRLVHETEMDFENRGRICPFTGEARAALALLPSGNKG